MFDKNIADELPSHKGYDYKFEFKKGILPADLPQTKIYNLGADKLRKVKEYLETMLAKRHIKPNGAAYASPILFVQKKDGGLKVLRRLS